jgi:hypothetical protein
MMDVVMSCPVSDENLMKTVVVDEVMAQPVNDIADSQGTCEQKCIACGYKQNKSSGQRKQNQGR